MANALPAPGSAGSGRLRITRDVLQALRQLARNVLVTRHSFRLRRPPFYLPCDRAVLRRVQHELARATTRAATALGVLAGSVSASSRLLGSRAARAEFRCSLDRRSLGLARPNLRVATRRLAETTGGRALCALAHSIFERRHARACGRGLVRRAVAADPEPQKAGLGVHAPERANSGIAARLLI